jgi:hypothetical protein
MRYQPAADRPVRSLYRTLSLPQGGRQVLGTDLKCSESEPLTQRSYAVIPISASSSTAVSAARPLSVSVYAPLSRLCAMNPRMAMGCIAWSMMPTEPWSVPVATQNKSTRSCALSFVVGFSHDLLPPPVLGKGEGSHCWLRSGLSSAVVWATHGRVVVIAAAALRGLGNSPRL